MDREMDVSLSLDAFDKDASAFRQKSYAQLGQDTMINSFLRAKPGSSGFYLDVGAYHPFRISNTYLFYEFGWSGICIDPNPATEKAYQKWRPRDTFVRCAIGDASGELDYWAFKTASQNTCDPRTGSNRASKHPDNLLGVIKTPVKTVDSILEEHAQGRALDFISIDVEGLEDRVFAGFDLDAWKPKVVVFESNERPATHLSSKFWKHLSAKGYELAVHTSRDAFYIRRV